MRNKGLIITNIVILSLIVIVLIFVLFVCINGKFKVFNFGIRSNNKICDETYDIQKISNIEILSNFGDVEVKECNDENIKVLVYGKSKDNLEIDSSNENELKIEYKEENKINFGFNQSSNIILYIPNTYSEKINIDTKCGDAEIEDFKNATINIDANYGDIKIGDVKNVTIKNDCGDVKIKSILNKLNIKSSYGDIKIDKLELNENSFIKSDLGDIKIEETNDIYIETDVSLGDAKVNNNNRHSEIILSIENNLGDIKVNN